MLMSYVEIILIGIGLSMDAFAVSVCKGLAMPKINIKYTCIIALFFGGFQFLMPILGWLLGGAFYDYISRYGSWISFALLAYIGGNMIIETIKEIKSNEEPKEETLNVDFKEFLILAVATSIDAFAVGVTFSLLSVNILVASIMIGITTFVLSLLAVQIGHRLGSKIGAPAKIAGGSILIFLGLRILILSLV